MENCNASVIGTYVQKKSSRKEKVWSEKINSCWASQLPLTDKFNE